MFVAVSTVGVVLLVAIALIALLAFSGYIAGSRRAAAHREEIDRMVRAANHALAEAHAADEGWNHDLLLQAARDAARARGFSDADTFELVLVDVDDQPGTDDDRAVFASIDHNDEEQVVLRRVDGQWVDAGR